MIDLNKLIKETEKLGVVVLWADLPESKGRHLKTDEHNIIFLDKNLDDIEACNVLLHERNHFMEDDFNNYLATVTTYSHHLENIAEKNRIIDFLNLINNEYPIDDSFNIYDYMTNAHINPRYEQLVLRVATELYQKNQSHNYKSKKG